MVHSRRSFVRLAAAASATVPWGLASVQAARAAPGGARPVGIPPPDPSYPGVLTCGTGQGLYAGHWSNSPYSVIGFVYRTGTIRRLDGSSQPNAIIEGGVVVGETVSHYERQAFRWANGTYQALGFLGGTDTIGGYSSTAAAVNAFGVIVGSSTTNSGTEHAFRWANNQLQDLGTLGGAVSQGTAINRSGQISGTSQTGGGDSHGFVWTAGTMRDLGTLGGRSSTVVAANDAGQIVGNSDTADGSSHAFLWNRGQMIDLGLLPGDTFASAVAINASGQVLVNSFGATHHAFIWDRGRRTRIELPGSTFDAAGINDRGYVCGTGQPSGTSNGHAYRWYQGKFTDLGTLGGSTSFASSITSTAVVLGSASVSDSAPSHAAFWPAPAT